MTWRRIVPGVLALLLILPVAGWYWLTGTESGTAWLFRQAASATGGAIAARDVSGTLRSGIRLEGFAYDDDSIGIEIGRAELTIDIGLFARVLEVESAVISGAAVVRRPVVQDAPAGRGLREVLSGLALPFRLELADVAAEQVRIDGLTEGAALVIETANLAGRWDDRFVVDRFSARTADSTWALRGHLALGGPNPLELDATVEMGPGLSGLARTVSASATASGDLDDIDFEFRVLQAKLTGRAEDVLGARRLDLRLDAPSIGWPLASDTPGIVATDLAVQLTGTPSDYTASASGVVELPGLSPLPVTLGGNGEPGAFTIEGFRLHGGQATGSGRVGWRDGLSVSLVTRLEELRLAAWLRSWSGEQVIDGSLSAGWSADGLSIRDAAVDIAAGEQLLSLDGRLDVAGVPERWSATGEIKVGTADFPDGTFGVVARGDLDGVVLDRLGGDLLGGRIAGTGSYRWRDAGAWSADIEMTGIVTDSLPFGVATELNGRIHGSGRRQPTEMAFELDGVHGTFRSKPLQADGSIRMRGGDVSVRRLEVRHGRSTASLDGALYGNDGLSYRIEVEELADYVGDASGGVRATGRVSLQDGRPFLRIDAESDQVAYRGVVMTGLRVTDAGAANQIVDVQVEADAVTVGERAANEVFATVRVDEEQQAASVIASFMGLRVDASLRGALDSPESPFRWNGFIDRLVLSEPEHDIALTAPAPLVIAADDVRVSAACLEGRQQTSLCTDFGWSETGGIDLRADLRSLPVNLVNRFTSTGFEFDQLVSGTLAWRQSVAGAIDGHGSLQLSAGTIVNPLRPDTPLATDAGELGFDIDNNNLLAGLVRLPVPDAGTIDGHFEVHDVVNWDESDISGTLSLSVSDLAPLAALLPILDGAGGHLDAAFELSGTLIEPRITGQASLENGVFSYSPIGLRLDDISLASVINGAGEIELQGTFRAGDGRAEIRTRSDVMNPDAEGLDFLLKGDDLTLINVPDLLVVADPDIEIGLDGQGLVIDGRIAVPRARVRPQNIGVGRTSESDDVVIVAGELPPAAEATQPTANVDIFGELEVTFGDDVAILLDVARTNLTGSVAFTWSGDAIPAANGRYDIDGTIVAFGQRLDIEEGGIRFPDVPATEPILRIRAVREIYGNTEVKQAGVLVTGSPRRPVVETFTVPMTTEERALTLLVTGSDFDYEQGVGAVDFGTYISPRFYASYGIGLFDQENVVRLRYDVARGFGVTATSGQKESGVDLTYRFEN